MYFSTEAHNRASVDAHKRDFDSTKNKVIVVYMITQCYAKYGVWYMWNSENLGLYVGNIQNLINTKIKDQSVFHLVNLSTLPSLFADYYEDGTNLKYEIWTYYLKNGIQ